MKVIKLWDETRGEGVPYLAVDSKTGEGICFVEVKLLDDMPKEFRDEFYRAYYGEETEEAY